MSADALHAQLLRPCIIHILRAAGFHSCKPSVLDTLADLAARHLLLIASNTAKQVYERTCTYPDHPASVLTPHGDTVLPTLPSIDDEVPTITDVRLGLAASAFFTQTMTPAEEAWTEELRRPLSSFHPLARPKERARRDDEDTRDVREFIDWITGPVNAEIRRIAGMNVTDTDVAIAGDEPVIKDDFLAALKKKHSKTGDGARYAGTVLGRAADADGQSTRIEGGPASLQEWREGLKPHHGGNDSLEVIGAVKANGHIAMKRKAADVDDFDEDAPLASSSASRAAGNNRMALEA
jgi:transcription initiation factor TFIID subunit 3